MMEHIWVLTMLVMVLTGKFAQCFEYEVSSEERLTFGEMTTFMQTDSHVYHMAADEHIPGNILFGDLHSLKTTDGNTMMTITGSPMSSGYLNGIGIQAEFNVITGFLQITPNEVIIIDYMNHCIRWLDRRNASVSDFAGKCEKGGYVDGMGTTARFQNPTSAIWDTRNTNHVIISDRYNNALRVLDVKTASVSTLLKSRSLNYPRAFTYDPTDEDTLIITQNYGIQKLLLPVMSRETISGGSVSGFKDGSLKDARYSFCRQILPLHDQIYILIDYGNHRLRVLDLLNDKVYSICTGITDHLDGPVSECQLKNPSSLLLIGNNLYIGTLTRIRLLQVSLEKIKVTTTTTTATTTTTTTTPTTTRIPRTPTTSTINSAILKTTKTSTAIKSTAFQPTKTSDIGGDQMPRETIPVESTAGLPAAETLQVKDNNLVIGLAVPLSGLLICVAAALIAFAIRKSKTAGTQSTSNVHAEDPSQLNNNNSGTSQGPRRVYYSRENEMSSFKDSPPPYELHYEDPVPSTQAPPAPSPYLPPYAPDPEHIYEEMDPCDPQYISFQNHSDQTLDNRALSRSDNPGYYRK